MNLKTFKWPEVSGVDLAFPTFASDPELLKEAHARGFGNETYYDRLFSKLFFSGGTLNFKPDLDEQFKLKATKYLKALMGSFEPKHEHKQAICALILSELVEPEPTPADPLAPLKAQVDTLEGGQK